MAKRANLMNQVDFGP